MKIKRVTCSMIMMVLLFLCVNTVFGASVYLGNPTPTGSDLEFFVTNGATYNFDLYLYISSADEDPGLFGAGIDVNYNSEIFTLSGTPLINTTAFTASSSEIIYPSYDELDYVTGDDFAFYVSDYDQKGLKGEILIGSFSLQSISNAMNGEWLITTGQYSEGSDFVTLDGNDFDDSVNFFGANATAIPIPGALLLFGSGFIGIIGVRRKLNK